MLSFPHLVVLFVIALLVFGPEKLPEIARQIGKVMGDFRKASTDFRRVIEQEFSEIERQTREKEEAARRKALEAGNAPNALAAQPAEATTTEAAGAPAGAIANTSAKDSGYSAWGAAPSPSIEDAAVVSSGSPPGTGPRPGDSASTKSENTASSADVHPA